MSMYSMTCTHVEIISTFTTECHIINTPSTHPIASSHLTYISAHHHHISSYIHHHTHHHHITHTPGYHQHTWTSSVHMYIISTHTHGHHQHTITWTSSAHMDIISTHVHTYHSHTQGQEEQCIPSNSFSKSQGTHPISE